MRWMPIIALLSLSYGVIAEDLPLENKMGLHTEVFTVRPDFLEKLKVADPVRLPVDATDALVP